MTSFAIHISEDFGQILAEIDRTVVEQQSSRSAVVRDILYDHFGIMPKDRLGERNRVDAAILRMKKMEKK
jgi:hypothetical protein